MSAPHTPVRGDLPAPNRMLAGRSVYRVVWQLNTDILVGYCWCGTSHEAVDPIELWDWLLAHPDTHGGGPQAPGPSGPSGQPQVSAPQVSAPVREHAAVAP